MFSEEVGQVFVPKTASFFFCGGGTARFCFFGDAGRFVAFEMDGGFGLDESAVLGNPEYLYHLVVATCNQQELPVFRNHEIPRVASRMHVSVLRKRSVLIDAEYGYAVVLETVGGVEPSARRVDMDVRATSCIYLIRLDSLDESESVRCLIYKDFT